MLTRINYCKLNCRSLELVFRCGEWTDKTVIASKTGDKQRLRLRSKHSTAAWLISRRLRCRGNSTQFVDEIRRRRGLDHIRRDHRWKVGRDLGQRVWQSPSFSSSITSPSPVIAPPLFPGFVSCKKKNRNAKNMASVGKLKAFYCRREQICHSHFHLSETWSKIVNKKRV